MIIKDLVLHNINKHLLSKMTNFRRIVFSRATSAFILPKIDDVLDKKSKLIINQVHNNDFSNDLTIECSKYCYQNQHNLS